MRRITYRVWEVFSARSGETYLVVYEPEVGRWLCTCRGFQVWGPRGSVCRHIKAIQELMAGKGVQAPLDVFVHRETPVET